MGTDSLADIARHLVSLRSGDCSPFVAACRTADYVRSRLSTERAPTRPRGRADISVLMAEEKGFGVEDRILSAAPVGRRPAREGGPTSAC